MTFEERYNFSDTGGTLASQSTLRFLELDKIKAIAAKCGLELSETFGNWKRERLGDESPEIIIQLMKAA
ncbi:hypothetical protein AIOL_003239 [Candidatus Rhodobacter oscarellae]|uniref:Uncharacterized protein n=1 Tax=Candidatus Rhodobacter oscarellae TaxID=1675527 RepID=A0A0J9GXR3_9RHOB|nr:hypothetical protein AIOL_003239 [Candidatus Rhodobacter lobularis]